MAECGPQSLRVVSWLRRSKEHDGEIVPATTMREVRVALKLLDELRLNLWLGPPLSSSVLLVDATGRIFVQTGQGLVDGYGQTVVDLPDGMLKILAPFSNDDGTSGPA